MDERRKDNTPGSITAQVRRGVPGGLYVYDNVRAAEPDIACRYAEALSRCIADERMAVYRGRSQGCADDAVRLYLWDRDVSNAVLRDLALVELALRNSIETQLRILLGDRWFESPVFATQSRLSRGLHMAKTSLASRAKDVTGSSLTAELTLGFWVNLFNSYFDSLWRDGLHRAFPGGRRQARAAGGAVWSLLGAVPVAGRQAAAQPVRASGAVGARLSYAQRPASSGRRRWRRRLYEGRGDAGPRPGAVRGRRQHGAPAAGPASGRQTMT